MIPPPMVPIDHHSLTANGIRFHVACAGPEDGPLVLFLHGFPECWWSWRAQLAALSTQHRCVAPDLRGYGETDKPAGGYDIDTLAADVVALIGALGHERATVVGHDWGAAIAWHVAEHHPGVVERLVILNCPPADVLLRAILTDPRQLARSWYILMFQLPWLADWWLSRAGAALIPRIFLSGASNLRVFDPVTLLRYQQDFARPGVASAALAYYRQVFRRMLRPDRLWRALKGRPQRLIEAPGLLIWGRDDPALGTALTEPLLARFAAPVALHLIDGCGHWTQQEAAQQVNILLARFLGEAPSGSG